MPRGWAGFYQATEDLGSVGKRVSSRAGKFIGRKNTQHWGRVVGRSYQHPVQNRPHTDGPFKPQMSRSNATASPIGWWKDLARWAAANDWTLRTRVGPEMPVLTIDPGRNEATIEGSLRWHPLDEIRLETSEDSDEREVDAVLRELLRFVESSGLSVRKFSLARKTLPEGKFQKTRRLPKVFARLCQRLEKNGGRRKSFFPRAETDLSRVEVEGFVWDPADKASRETEDVDPDGGLSPHTSVEFCKNVWATRRSKSEAQQRAGLQSFASASVFFRP